MTLLTIATPVAGCDQTYSVDIANFVGNVAKLAHFVVNIAKGLMPLTLDTIRKRDNMDGTALTTDVSGNKLVRACVIPGIAFGVVNYWIGECWGRGHSGPVAPSSNRLRCTINSYVAGIGVGQCWQQVPATQVLFGSCLIFLPAEEHTKCLAPTVTTR